MTQQIKFLLLSRFWVSPHFYESNSLINFQKLNKNFFFHLSASKWGLKIFFLLILFFFNIRLIILHLSFNFISDFQFSFCSKKTSPKNSILDQHNTYESDTWCFSKNWKFDSKLLYYKRFFSIMRNQMHASHMLESRAHNQCQLVSFCQ
jgi:hypothetical protein